ncbi:MAG TPA: dockerin type I domain-containing protein [Phycisphaerales bacterium]|nr:dockerin type I domain-containing protein [Phycisphaerales bacterium]HRQ74481.1 dockerin type I domain-containing protein [Phycisphaerales bacterium]
MLRNITATLILVLACAGLAMLAPSGHAVPSASVEDSPFTIKAAVDPHPNVASGWGFQLIGTVSLPDGTRLPRFVVQQAVPIEIENGLEHDSTTWDGTLSQASGMSSYSIAGYIVPSSNELFDTDRSGDLNNDGKTDVLDFLMMLNRVGQVLHESALESDSADLDGDGIISTSDLLLLLGSFGG